MKISSTSGFVGALVVGLGVAGDGLAGTVHYYRFEEGAAHAAAVGATCPTS